MADVLAGAPLPPAAMAASLAIVFLAGIVRGFAGFGFSALCVAGLSLLVSPAQVVPAIFMLEVLASVTLLRGALRVADWPWLGWLVLGNALFIPLGIVLLARLPEAGLRGAIGALLLTAALSLRTGAAAQLPPTRLVRLTTGLVSGLVNGLAAIGGIAVALLLSTSAMPPAVMRATLIVLFFFTDLWALACAAVLGGARGDDAALLGAHTLQWAAWLAPAMLAGLWVGQRSFAGVSPAVFRRQVLNLLLALATLVVLRALW